jgi:hypothetical protein
MAYSNNSLLFHRFYAGSAVCSPTRAAILTGRTPNRECITGAEVHSHIKSTAHQFQPLCQGCGQAPAYSCNDPLPLPPTTFTMAEAAKEVGYNTIHIGAHPLFVPKLIIRALIEGKWHLGNFWKKGLDKRPGFAAQKWPSSHPGMHGTPNPSDPTPAIRLSRV